MYKIDSVLNNPQSHKNQIKPFNCMQKKKKKKK